MKLHLFRRAERAPRAPAAAAPLDPSGTAAEAVLSDGDRRQVDGEVRRMIAEYRAKPTQEKEDGLGVKVATLPHAQREYVTTVLLRIVAEERGG